MIRNDFYVYGLYAPGRYKGSLFYIGKGTGQRMYTHKNDKKQSHKRNCILAAKGDWYPEKIKDGLSEAEAFKLEKELIAKYGPQLTNKTTGGEGTCGYKHSDIAKLAMSKANKGANNPQFGKAHSKKTKAKISKSNKGKKSGYTPSLETREKISIANKGRKSSAKAKLNISKGRLRIHQYTFEPVDFKSYHLWAFSISDLTYNEYCKNKIFTANMLKSWKYNALRQLEVGKHAKVSGETAALTN